jgi:hypothetical protein
MRVFTVASLMPRTSATSFTFRHELDELEERAMVHPGALCSFLAQPNGGSPDVAFLYANFTREESISGWTRKPTVAKMIGLDRMRLRVSGLLSDLLLFSCLATFVAGIVIAVASLLS